MVEVWKIEKLSTRGRFLYQVDLFWLNLDLYVSAWEICFSFSSIPVHFMLVKRVFLELQHVVTEMKGERRVTKKNRIVRFVGLAMLTPHTQPVIHQRLTVLSNVKLSFSNVLSPSDPHALSTYLRIPLPPFSLSLSLYHSQHKILEKNLGWIISSIFFGVYKKKTRKIKSQYILHWCYYQLNEKISLIWWWRFRSSIYTVKKKLIFKWIAINSRQ